MSASQTRVATRVGRRFSAPWVLAGTVALLVAVPGTFATLSAFFSLREAEIATVDGSIATRSEALSSTLGGAFSVADPVLDQLEGAVLDLPPGADAGELFPTLAALTTARPGMTWTSVGFSDGRFIGVRLYPDGRLRGIRYTPEGAGSREEFLDIDDPDRPVVMASNASTYDPRRRMWYQVAERARARRWTPPYAFLPDLHAGLSRVSPVYDPEHHRELIAVLTSDFDAVELSRLIADPLVDGQRAALVDAEGAVLALQGAELHLVPDPSVAIPRLDEIDDPLVRALQPLVENAHERVQHLEMAAETYRIDIREVVSLDGVHLYLVHALPTSHLYPQARREAIRGAFTTGLLALLGVALALALAAAMASLERRRARAERLARVAESTAIKLGSYELVEELGRGAMGAVYRARHVLLARDAALKLIRASETDDSPAAERVEAFFREARRLASLQSLHTVAVHDFGVTEEGEYYLVMELLEGMDLSELVRQEGPQPAARVANLLAQTCESLAEAHSKRLVHRDIKPANIFLARIADRMDFIKVLDFGLSMVVRRAETDELYPGRGVTIDERADGVESSDMLEGTPAFMSPEQILGQSIGPATDLYAVGGVGYFLLTGMRPYAPLSGVALLTAHANGPLPEWPAEVRETAPPELIEVLEHCLQKDPKARPKSARELAEHFSAIAESCTEGFDERARRRFWKDFDERRSTASSQRPRQTMTIRVQQDQRSLIEPRAAQRKA